MAHNIEQVTPPPLPACRPSLSGHLAIARFDHWIKNVFVLPGIVLAIRVAPPNNWFDLAIKVCLGCLAVGVICSSNYILNEILDAPSDRYHPIKFKRPVPSGKVSIPWAYVQWLLFMVAGMLMAWHISPQFTATMAGLWIMGILYNVPPVRLKDLPYCDVLSESVNNPLRLLAGWYIVCSLIPPPLSLLVSYWMIGCYFMAIKRFAEYREIANSAIGAAYRKSFAHYSEQRLLVSIMFYGSFAMLTLGSFIVRYRLELVLAYPLVAIVMAVYLNLSFKPNSPAQSPEHLYRDPALVTSVVCCAALMTLLLFVDIPQVAQLFTPENSPLPALH